MPHSGRPGLRAAGTEGGSLGGYSHQVGPSCFTDCAFVLVFMLGLDARGLISEWMDGLTDFRVGESGKGFRVWKLKLNNGLVISLSPIPGSLF